MPVTDEEKSILKEKYRQFVMDASQNGDWPPEIIAAMMSRESRCGLALIPKKPGGNPAGTGDAGHGHGLMQIDDRSHKSFIDSGKWKDPKENIYYGVKVLNESYDYLEKKTNLKDDDLMAAAIAGYNCGAGNVIRSLKEGKSWDARTKGRNYSGDVLARSIELADLFRVVSSVTDAMAPDAAASLRFRVNTDGLNLLSKPLMVSSTKIGILERGHLVTKIREDTDPTWWKIDTALRGIQIQGYLNHNNLIAEKDYQAPDHLTGIVAVNLTEDLAKVARNVDNWRAYPLGEPNRPGRKGTTAGEKVQELTEVITWLNVEQSARYQPKRVTFCNIYAYDYCYLAGVYLPRVWWNRNSIALLSAGEAVPVVYDKTVYECNVNSLFNWLGEFGEHFGWEAMDPKNLTALQKAANEGDVVVICAQNAHGNRSGHIAMVVPEAGKDTAVWRKDGQISKLLSSQAGRHNYNYWNPGPWWKGDQFRNFGFWKHA